jgi:hypothetical protein
MEAINSCRFCGKLVEFKASVVGEGKVLLGKGLLFLPDPENPNIGQNISINAWEDMARRLEQVGSETWITILTSYMPSTFRGILQDTFNVTSLVIHE